MISPSCHIRIFCGKSIGERYALDPSGLLSDSDYLIYLQLDAMGSIVAYPDRILDDDFLEMIYGMVLHRVLVCYDGYPSVSGFSLVVAQL